MHSTDCCAVRYSVEVAYCERLNKWRAVAVPDTVIDLERWETILAYRYSTNVERFLWSIPDPWWQFAKVADAPTPGQAALLACARIEQALGEHELHDQVQEVLAGNSWRSMPAPRRTPQTYEESASC